MAGAIDETFSARFVASIAVFNRSMAPSRPLGCWDPAFMVETRGGGRRTVGCEGCEKDSYSKRARRLAQTSLACGEENCIRGRSAEKRRAWSIRRPQYVLTPHLSSKTPSVMERCFILRPPAQRCAFTLVTSSHPGHPGTFSKHIYHVLSSVTPPSPTTDLRRSSTSV